MIRGLYTSGLGMQVQMKNMDVLSNNIANVDTTAFKRDVSVTQSFSKELMKRLDDPSGVVKEHETEIGDVSLGVFVNSVYTDFSAGRFVLTSGVYDLAIDGDGFFAVNTLDEEGNVLVKFTRDGSFTLNQDRFLVTKEGNFVAGQEGNIFIPDGACVIRDDGAIYVDGEYVDTLNLVAFDNPDSLRKTGDNLYTATNEAIPAEVFPGTVIQGYLEGSNVNSISEMVKMIAVSRAYEANQKMVTFHDTILGRAVTDIGRK